LLVLVVINFGCFDVVFDVSKRSALPGEYIDVTATIFTQASGLFDWPTGVYFEIPESWTLDYVDTMWWNSNSYLGQSTTDFQRAYENQLNILTAEKYTHCLDGVNYNQQMFVPRPGYKTYRVRFLYQQLSSNTQGWASVRARVLVSGEAGETYTVRAWGGTTTKPDKGNTERCALFEVPVKIALFADDLESGNSSEWTVTDPHPAS
jgi:hypothetical protein